MTKLSMNRLYYCALRKRIKNVENFFLRFDKLYIEAHDG